MTVRRAARITGRVQGVSFRYYTRQEAERRGLSGWVRNEGDGSVRLEAQGPEGDVEDLLSWAGQGPSSARVADVEVEDRPVDDSETGFQVRH